MCSFQEAREAVSSSLSEVYLLRGLSGFCLGLDWFTVLLSVCLIVLGVLCICFLFWEFSFSVKVKASKPLGDPGCQYQRPFSGLGCLCLIFSPILYLPAGWFSSEHGYPRAVITQHTVDHVLSQWQSQVCLVAFQPGWGSHSLLWWEVLLSGFGVWSCTVSRLGHLILSLCRLVDVLIEKTKEKNYLFYGF